MMLPILRILALETENDGAELASYAPMASAIAEIKRSRGRCTPKDLSAKGFTLKQISLGWHMAHSVASLAIMASEQTTA